VPGLLAILVMGRSVEELTARAADAIHLYWENVRTEVLDIDAPREPKSDCRPEIGWRWRPGRLRRFGRYGQASGPPRDRGMMSFERSLHRPRILTRDVLQEFQQSLLDPILAADGVLVKQGPERPNIEWQLIEFPPSAIRITGFPIASA
jgi:hypothetical protein